MTQSVVQPHPGSGAAARLLIVDSDRERSLLLGRRLGQQGYRIVAVHSVAAALTELARAPIDLLLADVQLPPSDGIELARLVRGEASWQDLPIILITGRSNPRAAIDALAAGADDVVVKPFEFQMLFARIARQHVRARALGELRRDNAALDARVVRRAIELGEATRRLMHSEAERRRLAALVEIRSARTAD